VVPEAPLERSDGGLVPQGEGWFVVNAKEARWWASEFGPYTRFEGDEDAKFKEIGINIGVLQPGQPACMYHGEEAQENFLVLSGECLLLVEGEERQLRQWDFVHCPPWTEHVFVGAGDGPCTILAIGTRIAEGLIYPESELAQRHGAGVDKETTSGQEAYAKWGPPVETAYREGWLPD
jgi:uncharacterized cupin superfamily protein